MKTADLTSGESYCYQPRSFSTPVKVTVLTAKVTNERVKERHGFGGTRNVRKSGVKIQFKDGRVDVVRPQTLVSTWAEHKQEIKTQKAYDAEVAVRRAATLKRNAETVVALDVLLRVKGAKVRPGAYCYDDAEAAALRAAGMPPAVRDDHNEDLAEGYEDEYVGRDDHFSSVFYDLDDALKGRFDLDVLAVLVEPQAEEGSA